MNNDQFSKLNSFLNKYSFPQSQYSKRDHLNKTPNSQSESSKYKEYLKAYLLSLLNNLHDVEQSPRFHPEVNALYHSLQVYQCASNDTDDPELLAAALLHDVGKAIDYPKHDKAGAEALAGLLSPRIIWLIRHHLDLLVCPRKTRSRLSGSMKLIDLEKLRTWDLAGRSTCIEVPEVEIALNTIFHQYPVIINLSSGIDYWR